jgi:hypothetical protein
MKRSDLKFMPKFFDRYILLIDKNAELIEKLENTKNDFEYVKDKLLKFENYRYQANKWTPKDILQHIIDNERIQSYRSLAFARGDHSILPGYEENLYAQNTNANDRTIPDLLEEFKICRDASAMLFKNFKDEQLLKTGICFEIEVTPLALGFQIIGHAVHHLNILNERYFR